MELFGLRLVGFNTDTLTKLLLAAAVVSTALLVRTVSSTPSSRRATRRGVCGDRIQIGDVRGDVLDIGPFETPLMEMGVPPALLPNPNKYLRITDSWVELSVRFLFRAWGATSSRPPAGGPDAPARGGGPQ